MKEEVILKDIYKNMKPLFKINHSTIYNGKEENPVFNDEAMQAAKSIQPDKKGLRKAFEELGKIDFKYNTRTP